MIGASYTSVAGTSSNANMADRAEESALLTSLSEADNT